MLRLHAATWGALAEIAVHADAVVRVLGFLGAVGIALLRLVQ